MTKFAMLALGAIAMIPGNAFAYDWSGSAKVMLIEATYAPSNLPFQIDRTIGNCPVGQMVFWHPQGADAATQTANYQAILALLITAKSTGQSVTVFGNNANCTIDYIYLN